MLNELWKIISPPVFPEDEDKTRKAKYANGIMLVFLAFVIIFETLIRCLAGYTGLSIMDLIMAGLAVLFITGLVLLRRGYVQLTSVLLVSLVWTATNAIAATGFGAKLGSQHPEGPRLHWRNPAQGRMVSGEA